MPPIPPPGGGDCSDYTYYETPPSGGTWTNYVIDECGGSKQGVENPHGHHIVMKGTRYAENAQARTILCKYGIDPYTDCRNLVISRNFCHSRRYAKHVLAELQKADNEDATAGTIARALKKIAAWHKRCGDPGDVAETTDEL